MSPVSSAETFAAVEPHESHEKVFCQSTRKVSSNECGKAEGGEDWAKFCKHFTRNALNRGRVL